MKMFTVPAQYQREIEHAVKRAVETCKRDALLRGSEPFHRGILQPWELDEGKTGNLLIVIAEPHEGIALGLHAAEAESACIPRPAVIPALPTDNTFFSSKHG